MLAPPFLDALDGEQVTDGAAKALDLIGGGHRQSQTVAELPRPVAAVLAEIPRPPPLFVLVERGELDGQIRDQELRVAVGNLPGLRGPDHRRPPAGQPLFEHRPDAAAYAAVVAGHGFGLLLDEQGHVGILLEAVAHAVEVEIQALLPELFQAGLRGRAVEVGANADPQQLGLGDSRRQQVAVLAPGTAQPAERVQQDGRRQAARGLPAGLDGGFPRAAVVDAPRPGVGADEVVLQTGLKVLPLPDFLEEGESNVALLHGNVAGAEQQPRPARTVGRAQAGRQEPQGAARALELGHRRPAFPHQVHEGRVERIRCLNPVAQRQPLLVRLPPFRLALCMGAPHPRVHLAPRAGRGAGRLPVRRLREQPPLDHVEDLVALDRLPALVLARGEMLDGAQQARVLERFAPARLERVDQHRVVQVADRRRQPLEEQQRLVAERGFLHPNAARADEVPQDLVQQDQTRTAPEQRDDRVAARGHAPLILSPDDLVAVASAERPGDPAPQRLGGEVLVRRALAVRRIEELAVRHGHAHPRRPRQPRRLRQGVERWPRPRRVQQRGQRVRLAAAEGGQQLEHAVAPGAGQPPEHILQQRLETARQVRRAEEAVSVAVDRRHPRQRRLRHPEVLSDQIVGQRAEVEREDVLGELGRQDVGMQLDAFEPGAGCRAHRTSAS